MRYDEIPHGTMRGYRLEYANPEYTTCDLCRAAFWAYGRYHQKVNALILKLLKKSNPKFFDLLQKEAQKRLEQEFGVTPEGKFKK